MDIDTAARWAETFMTWRSQKLMSFKHDNESVVLSLADITYLLKLAAKDKKFAAILNTLNDEIDFVVDLHTDEEEW